MAMNAGESGAVPRVACAPVLRSSAPALAAVRRVLFGVAAIITVTSIIGPLAEQARAYQLSSLAYDLDWWVCHQLPSRSFWLFGRPLGVCIRCSGLYLGILVGAALHATGWVVSRRSAAMLVLSMLAHVSFQASTGMVIHPFRFMTGIMAGAGIWALLMSSARKDAPFAT